MTEAFVLLTAVPYEGEIVNGVYSGEGKAFLAADARWGHTLGWIWHATDQEWRARPPTGNYDGIEAVVRLFEVDAEAR